MTYYVIYYDDILTHWFWRSKVSCGPLLSPIRRPKDKTVLLLVNNQLLVCFAVGKNNAACKHNITWHSKTRYWHKASSLGRGHPRALFYSRLDCAFRAAVRSFIFCWFWHHLRTKTFSTVTSCLRDLDLAFVLTFVLEARERKAYFWYL